jgi:hypothetical protein
MRVRRNCLVLLAALAIVVSCVGVTPAAAMVERIPGGAHCSMSNASFSFSPGLRNRFHIEGIQHGRGPSLATFTADLGSCTDPSSGPAPAGIDHATLNGTGKVPGSNCEKLDRLKVKTTISWMTADDTIVGTTVVKLGIGIAKPHFESPWTVTFAGTARRSSHVFPLDPVGFVLDTTLNNFPGLAEACFKSSLDSLAFNGGPFAADPPP